LKKKIIISVVLIILGFACITAFLTYKGIIILNNPSTDKYPVRGVDVSSYQGEIDWNKLSDNHIQFAFIKATEGSTFVDDRFNYNLSEALKTNLRIGAYHFFSYDSSGKTQAENFISNVPVIENMLPPAIDVEFYGDKEKNPPDKVTVQKELDVLINMLESRYGVKPIIYATEKSYKLYIADFYNDSDIWIRNVVSQPSLSANRKWTFWQYTDREKLDGYNGKEKHIDMNVFFGTPHDFDKYAK
jgi:Lyzozyme M1 (1,4-beta-N-acetylmuramidase)